MVILHILALYAALWVFVKVHSAAIDSLDPDAALRRVKSYSAPTIRREDRKTVAVPTASRRDRKGPPCRQ
jgi:hypothetical protein